MSISIAANLEQSTRVESKKMDLIVDIQFCVDIRGKNIVKEIAIVALKNNYIAHWVISPPYSIQKLGSEVRRQNGWLQKNCHGISWTDGDVSQTRVKKNLSDILKNAEKIYVRGREKLTFLSDLTINEIINLEENEDCPSFEKLTWVDAYCLYHASKFSYLGYSCALNNAAKLKSWLEKTQKNDEQLGTGTTFGSTSESYGGCLSQRSDSPKLAETDCLYLQYSGF